jgi:hypothetical protein
MKHLVCSLMMTFFIGSAFCQNGGQFPENNSLKMEWSGTSVKITNKQSCETVVKVVYSQSEIDLTIAANSSMIFMPPASVATVRAKALTNCGSTDFGWIELGLTAMPLKFVSFDFAAIGRREVVATFETAETSNVRIYYILASTDGVNYKRIDSIKADQVTPNRKYSIKINTVYFKK